MVNAAQSSARRPFDGCVHAGGSGLRLRVHSSRRVDRSVLRRDLSHERGLARGAPARVYRKPSRFAKEPAPDLTLAAQQLSAVMAAPFEKQKVLSWPEYKVFSIIEDVAVTARRGHRVYAQTSLGEILSSPSEDAFR